MDESDFSGIGGMDETVCLAHFSDPVLRDQLRLQLTEYVCSFCGRKALDGEGAFAVSMDEVGVLVWEAMNWLYQETWDVQYYDGEPLSYEDEPSLYEANDVIYETVEEAVEPKFSEAIVERLKSAMSSSDYWIGREHEAQFSYNWTSFSNAVRFESRFVFIGSSSRKGHEDEPPARVAKFLDGLLAFVSSDLLIELPADTKLYRGRMTDDVEKLRERIEKEPSTELGSAPSHLAAAGRLNPQGIGLFYAANEVNTAVAEIALHSKYDDCVVGEFITQRPLQILDFTRTLNDLPSIFASDEKSRTLWKFARFAKRFTERITSPVLLDGRERVDYTPTGVVAEYLRWVPDIRIDGIAWPSHVAVGNGKNVVLFFGPGQDFQTDPPTASELNRDHGSRTPTLILPLTGLDEYTVKRSVDVEPLGRI